MVSRKSYKSKLNRRLMIRCLCLIALMIAGCNPGDGKIPVSGIVKLGDAPLEGATVGFIGNSGGQVAHALTDATGRFTVRATPGINKVIVNKPADPSALAAGNGGTTDEGASDMLAGAEVGVQPTKPSAKEWIVDEKFTSPLTSGLEFDVKEGMAEVELVVTGP